MGVMTQTAIRAAIRAVLAGTSTPWTDAIVDQAINDAATDLERYGLPYERVYDYTVDYSVEDEDWTTDADTLATAISLANSPIEPGSETVESTDGATTYTRDTDYSIDYANGTITPIAAGDLEVGTEYHISYNKTRIGIPLSSLDGMISVERVFCKAKTVPQTAVTFYIWNDVLYVTSSPDENDASQKKLSDGDHIWVFYNAQHTIPGVAGATWPDYLDEVVVLGASAYCLLSKAVEIEIYSYDRMVAGIQAWADVDIHCDNAAGAITSGTPYINTVNLGKDVPEIYGQYATVQVNIAMAHRDRATYQLETAQTAFSLSEQLRQSGNLRLAKFIAILRDKAQMRRSNNLSQTHQFVMG